ncbi:MULTISPECIES: TraB/GumN family protein [Paenibacillus]|nr:MULTISPECIES: TraB/GumN family protein [Paenibacillus]
MDQSSIIVVGAAHSLGDDSIVKLLEDKGYEVK